jgi:hypothetical protein
MTHKTTRNEPDSIVPIYDFRLVFLCCRTVVFRQTLKAASKRLTLFRLSYFYTMKMDETFSSETSVLTRSTRPHIREDDILHIPALISHCFILSVIHFLLAYILYSICYLGYYLC